MAISLQKWPTSPPPTQDESSEPFLAYDKSSAPPKPQGGQTRYLLIFCLSICLGLILLIVVGTVQNLREGAAAVDAQWQPEQRRDGIPQRVQRPWSPAEEELRSYRWEAPQVHASLQQHLDELTPNENETYQWLLQTRTKSQGGVGIGLGASDPPEPMREGAGDGSRGWPRAGEGPGMFEGGSRSKYYELLEEWRTGRPVSVCEKGAWEDQYAQLHDDIVKGRREARLMEYACHQEGKCGGLADRLLGTLTLFLSSILTSRALVISWSQPVPFDLIFDSPNIDWSAGTPFPSSSSTSEVFQASKEKGMKEVNAINWYPGKLDSFFGRKVAQFKEGSVRVSLNRGGVFRSFNLPSLRPKLDALGFKATTVYACLLPYLIRPKASSLEFIHRYSSFFALPSTFVVGVQIRTGDFSLRETPFDQLQTLERYSTYFACASSLAATYAHPSQKVIYYLLTDSHALRAEALDRWPDRIVVSGLSQSHPEIEIAESGYGWTGIKGAADGMMNSVAEMWTFAATDYQILTARSGFGKIPTWLRGRRDTTVQIFNPHLELAYTKTLKELPEPPDCTSGDAFKTFEEMAQGWSLG